MMLRTLFIWSLSVCVAVAKNEQYEGHSVYEITVSDVGQAKLVSQLETALPVDVWAPALPGRPGRALVPPAARGRLEEVLAAAGVQFKVAVEDVREEIKLEEDLLTLAARSSNASRSRASNFPFDTIHRYDVINAYLEELARQHPRTVQLASAGRSFQGRDIKYLKISSTNFQDESKPVVMMESLLHCREWAGLPATLYALRRLVVEAAEPAMLRDVDWLVVPIANPDGYEHTHTSARFWRKNRATGYMAGDFCVGVDLNRNFDMNFGQASSASACSDTFHGRAAFSEPETAALRDLILQHRHRLALFLDIHSFGSMILYGYGNGVLPPNGQHVHAAARRMAAAIDSVKWPTNPDYIVGNVASVLYQASGSAQDYAQSVGATLSYTYELPAYRNTATITGFLVDPAFIEQAGFETWEGIKAGARYALENFRKRTRNFA